MNARFCSALLILLLFLFGCAHVISKELRTRSEPSLTLGQVRQNLEAFKGKMVLWGGEIIETTNLKDASTQIEVFQMPLGWRGEPKAKAFSEGRFLVLTDRTLDPHLYRKGRKVTVAGEILGEKMKPLGEMEYRYPLLLAKEIHLWPEYASSPYPYYDYDPWWYYYGPRWYWGTGFYYYHRRH